MSTPQRPLKSGLGPATTAREIASGKDLSGKTAVVTGGYAGLGLETARVMAAAGAWVVIPARDLDKARRNLDTLPAQVTARIEVLPMDLADPASIDAFADAFLADARPLSWLINNAGIMFTPLERDARGYESQFAVNHLGHFQLTRRLLPALRAAAGALGEARVVTLSSRGHRYSNVDFDDPNYQRRPYTPVIGYGQSKTANILFSLGLDAREAERGVRAFAVHPGMVVATDLSRHLPAGQLQAIGVVDAAGAPIIDPVKRLKNIEQGAATSLWCALSPQLAGQGGVYCEDCDITEIVPAAEGADWGTPGHPRQTGVMAYAVDPEAAERLWTLSEAMLAV